MLQLDSDPNVIQWSSEEIIIPYTSPLDNKIHRYYTDFFVKKLHEGKVIEFISEIKPKIQCSPPKVQKNPNKSYVDQVCKWAVNSAKWEAAKKFCKTKGWDFVVLNEDNLNIDKKAWGKVL
jgi:hypothetical protein